MDMAATLSRLSYYIKASGVVKVKTGEILADRRKEMLFRTSAPSRDGCG